MLTELGSHSNNIIMHMQMLAPQTHHMFEMVKVCPMLITWMPDVWCI